MNLLTKQIVLFITLSLLFTSTIAGEQNNAFAGPDAPKSFADTLSGQERAWLKDHPVITVAIDSGWPPVEFKNDRGEPSGMSQEYLNLVEQKLGVEFKRIQNMSWQEMYSLLKRREIDMTSCVAVTPERKEFWSFTRPYMKIPIVIATQMNIPYIGGMDELFGRKVALVEGYAIDDWITKDFPEIRIVRVRTALEGLQLLQSGEVYAYIDNLLIIGDYQAKMEITNIKIAGQTPYVNAQCMAVRKDWTILTGIIQKALDSISETEQKEIYRKWLPVRYEYGFNYTLFWQVLVGFIVILVMLGLWNWKLAREIRSRKLAQKELREKEFLIRSISDNIQSGVIYQVVVAKDGSRKFTYLSGSVRFFYGITPEEGMADAGLMYSKVYEEDIGRLSREEEVAINTLSTFKTEVRIKTLYGRLRWASLVSIPRLLDDGSICFDGIEFDITEQKNAQEKINNLLREKELLLQEVHHRIKNNMNTIKGLLALQLTAEENSSAAASLRDAESRVQSMIMLYDRLYCTDNYRELPVKEYMNLLVEEIIASFPNRGIIKVKTEIDDFILNVNILSPLGIILNELLTNMMKYAFTGRESGVITLSASMKDNHVKILIQDDGVGIPDSVSFETHTGFGLELVRMLIDQIEGNIKIERGEGTKFILEFEA